MQKLRALLPGSHHHQNGASPQQNSSSSAATSIEAANGAGADYVDMQRQSIALEPEVGFQITIESSQQNVATQSQQSTNAATLDAMCQQQHHQKASIPELNVHLLAARHLPNLFGFKIVQGYQVKVKLFPGSKRLDSSIQTNSWPKFNENFRFALLPDIKPSLKHSSAKSMTVSELFTPDELFAGQFVVFTVYALLELPPASFNRFNKTYRSLRDKSSNLVQKVVESSTGKSRDVQENGDDMGENGDSRKSKRKSKEHARDAIPALTISESRRNLGSVTCYLEPKLFKRNARTGIFATDELWLPIKDITTTAKRTKTTDLSNAPKGVVEIILEIRDTTPKPDDMANSDENDSRNSNTFERIKSALTPPRTPTTPTTTTAPVFPDSSNNNNNNNSFVSRSQQWAMDVRQRISTKSTTSIASSTPQHPTDNNNSNSNISNNNNNNNNSSNTATKTPQWQRMTAEVKRKMGMSNISKSLLLQHERVLRITTARMRCNQKVKDELECTAGSVYVKTAVFEHGIYVDSWKSPNFYPSLSTKWNANDDIATLQIPLPNVANSVESLQHLLIRIRLATKTKMGKKLVLGTVLIGAKILTGAAANGATHMQQLMEAPTNQPISMWHSYQ